MMNVPLNNKHKSDKDGGSMPIPELIEEIKRIFGSVGYEVENIDVRDASEEENSQTG